ncbi:hypothetical protein DVH24_030728 [Malus domestica]|uniref:Smr domain-containing protein n=1 Tax=Malus domestica TaxID=3750 RepID=A0A498HG02_MALDO|nr:hypothetical protein DVH24_030728 [Malus domestica]
MAIGLDRVLYNTLLSLYGKLGRFEDALNVCKEMESVGIAKVVVSYNALLGGLRMYNEMKEERVSPNILTYSTLIDVFSKGGLYAEAMKTGSSSSVSGGRVFEIHAGDREDNRFMKMFGQLAAEKAGYAIKDRKKQGAQLVVLEGKRQNVWESVWSDSCLDLHLTSSRAARAMVHAWLLNIRAIVFKGQQLPNLLSILTGWGKHSKVVADSTLRRAIEALLTSTGAPFHVAKCI